MKRALKHCWIVGILFTTSAFALQAAPGPELFACDDGEEIPIFKVCDFIADCADGSDEHADCSTQDDASTSSEEEVDASSASIDATSSGADAGEEADLPAILADTETEEEEEWTGCHTSQPSGSLFLFALLAAVLLVSRWTTPEAQFPKNS